MTEPVPYKTPKAFRTALDSRLRNTAENTTATINELRRQFTYSRFLARVFAANPDSWVLKGGSLLLARFPDKARHSLDIDLFYANNTTAAISELQQLGADDTHVDYFTFDVSKGQTIGKGVRAKIVAYLGPTEYERFGIDIVVSSNMTQRPDSIQPIKPVTIPGIESPNYRGYPIVDHIADKHAAMLETHNNQPSSRYRDLLDLVIFATTAQIQAAPLHKALFSEYRHRKIQPPTSVELPSPSWNNGYKTLPKPDFIAEQTADQAIQTVKALLDPILHGQQHGNWNPETINWD